jgi:hypothetical protein
LSANCPPRRPCPAVFPVDTRLRPAAAPAIVGGASP